jgi:uncharacterized protein DUF1566
MKKKSVLSILGGIGIFISCVTFVRADAVKPWGNITDGSTRFVVLSEFSGQAVLDRSTGLIWEKTPASVSANWVIQTNVCIARSPGGPFGWRMPRFEEIASLFNEGTVTPGGLSVLLPTGHPFTNISGDYWTSSQNPIDPNQARIFNTSFYDNSYSDKSISFRVWCVRGGSN